MSDLHEFEFSDFHKWKQLITGDDQKDVNDLVSGPHTNDFVQPPYVDYTSTSDDNIIASYRNCTSHHGAEWQGARYWIHMEQVTSGDPVTMNQLALTALAGGSEGVIFPLDLSVNGEQLLKDISLADCFLGVEGTTEVVKEMLQYTEASNLRLQGYAKLRDLDQQILDGKLRPDWFNNQQDFRKLVFDMNPSKYGSLNELAMIMSRTVWVINELQEAEIPMNVILGNIQLKLELSKEYLWEICRIRSLRILFHQLVCQYGIDYSPQSLVIHAATGGLQAKANEKNYQLIGQTPQAMAAILGGADILTIKPADQMEGIADEDTRRVARNVSHILREECHLHQVADPVAGSFYLEDLTVRMMKKVWSMFQQYERLGGYLEISKASI